MHLPGQCNGVRQPQRRQDLRQKSASGDICHIHLTKQQQRVQTCSCQRQRHPAIARTVLLIIPDALLHDLRLTPRACRQRPSSSPNVKMRTAPSSATASWLRAPAGLPGSDSPSATPTRRGLQPESCHAGSCQAGSCAAWDSLHADRIRLALCNLDQTLRPYAPQLFERSASFFDILRAHVTQSP